MTTPDTARLAEIAARLDAAKPRPETHWRRPLLAAAEMERHAPDDLPFLLSLVEQLQGQLDKAAQARLDAATDLHWPTTIDGRLDLVCGNSSDHGAWRHWPCPDAEALGLDKENTE